MRTHINRINKAIEIIFFLTFLTVPLAMWPTTSELFEFNKMWLLFIYGLLIFFFWGVKMVILKRFEVRRTPFDIPLMLFLISQIISTVISLDPHTSFWGYYSRFNGGLLSTICYIFLYYAFATNILTYDKDESFEKVKKFLYAIVISGVIVALWGLPSHFGYDPTCLLFRGQLDVSCWTAAFQPKVRMFSTLGQPNWLAAFMLILLPIAMAITIDIAKKVKKSNLFSRPLLLTIAFLIADIIFYLDLVFTLSQSGFIGFWVGNFVFFVIFALLTLRKNAFSVKESLKKKSIKTLILIEIIFVLLTLVTLNPIPRLQNYNIYHVIESLEHKKNTVKTPPPDTSQPALEASITGSGQIREIVWRGAIDIWKAYPIFGTGVETYAFAYYKFRPASHNLTSEWDYLYNKAHNEFLNYLATTGAFGLLTYLSFIFLFFYIAFKNAYKKFERKIVGDPILPAIIGSFVGIQISNFFGFSVVVVNYLMFLLPLFYWSLEKPKVSFLKIPKDEREDHVPSNPLSATQMTLVVVIAIIAVYCILFLANFWRADINYALGYNYDRINDFASANPYLVKAVDMRGGEDLYKNELSVNDAALAILFAQQKDIKNAQAYATRSKELSDEVAADNPNNVVYWKARTRVMFSLGELSPGLMQDAVKAIEKAHALAPTDAKVLYNEALIYDQVGDRKKALNAINETIKIKDNYRDAYYAKALFLSEMAKSEKDKTKAQSEKDEAISTLNFTLKNIAPNDPQAKDLLKTLE